MRKHQERAAIIRDNMNDPFRPRSLKAPRPIAEQAKASARVRTNDAPTEMGKASARFYDPVGNAMKARLETKRPRLDMSYRWTEGEACDGDLYIHDARERDRMTQFLVMSSVNRDRGFKPEDAPKACPVSVVAFEPIRLGIAATVVVTAHDAPGLAFVYPAYSHYTLEETRPLAFSVSLKDRPTGRAIPLPSNPVTVSTHAPWSHPKPRAGLVVTVVTKTDDAVSFDAGPWNAKTRKQLFNRIPIQSRSAKKRGFRLVPRNPNTVVYGYLA